MKPNPAEKEILDRMRPGVLSADGFLGKDPRSLDQMIAEDVAVLEGEGVTIKELGAVLDKLHEQVDAALGDPILLADGKVRAEEYEVMGRIPCPFGCGMLAHKAIIKVAFNDKKLLLTPLHGHLIGEHGFFQGRGTTFRLEPKDAAELFNLLSS